MHFPGLVWLLPQRLRSKQKIKNEGLSCWWYWIRRKKGEPSAEIPLPPFKHGGGSIARTDPEYIIKQALLNCLSLWACKFSQPGLLNTLFQRRKPVWIWTSPEPCLAYLQTVVPVRHLKLYNSIFKHLWDLNCVPLKWKKKKKRWWGDRQRKNILRLPARVISPKCFVKDLMTF